MMRPFIYLVVCVCCWECVASGIFRTVEIRPQFGVTITSAQLIRGSAPSQYFRYMYIKYQEPSLWNSHFFPQQVCSYQMLGFYNNYSVAHNTHMPVFPLRHNGLQSNLSEYQAHVQVHDQSGKSILVRCYVQQFAARRLQSVRGHEYVAFLAYFCPILEPAHCLRFDRRVSVGAKAMPLNVTITTVYHHNGHMTGYRMDDLKVQAADMLTHRVELVNYALLNAIPPLPAADNAPGTTPVPTVGVITTIGYAPDDAYRRQVMEAMIARWMDHYRHLNMRIVVHDASRFGVPHSSASNVHYFNYSVFSLLGISPLAPDGNHSRGYDPSKQVRYELHKLFDIDKSATYTHARFELAALFGLESVLVIDFDEFLYCANPLMMKGDAPVNVSSYAGQIEALRRMIALHQGSEINLPDFVPKKRVDDPIQSCLMNRTIGGESIFNCLSDLSHVSVNSPKLKKALHTTISCPFTHFHGSCVEHRYEEPYFCECQRFYPQHTQCAIVHYEFKVKNRYKTNINASASELVYLS
jgi:hypothetical protein